MRRLAKDCGAEQRLTELEPKPAPKPRQHRPVTIDTVMPIASADALPDAEEFVELQRIVLAKFPRLAPMANAARRRTNFICSFSGRFVGSWSLAGWSVIAWIRVVFC